jgi:hypothetical protein
MSKIYFKILNHLMNNSTADDRVDRMSMPDQPRMMSIDDRYRLSDSC